MNKSYQTNFAILKRRQSFLKKGLMMLLLSTSIFTSANAQYCNSAASYTADEDIYNVTFGSFSNSSTCASVGPGSSSIQNTYSDYTSLAGPNIIAGSTVPLSVEIGTCNTFGSLYDNLVGVYIDYNRDNVFDVTEQVYLSTTYTHGPHTETASITIPSTVSFGQTRMRVINIETTSLSDMDPCVSYGWGETEDYTITLLPPTPPPCVTAPISPVQGNTVCVGSTTLRWNKRGSATGYDVFLNTGTATPTTRVALNQADTFYTFTATANDYSWKIVPKLGSLESNGCSFFNFKAMTSITPDVSITRSPAADTLCPRDTVRFTAAAVNPGVSPTYQWKKNGVNVGPNSSVYIDNTLTANDTISVVLTTSITGACVTKTSTNSNQIRIKYRTAPDATVTVSGNTSFCEGGNVRLTVPTGAANYQWQNNGGNLTSITSNTYQINNTGVYTVKVTASNGCSITSDPVTVNAYTAPLPHITRVGYVASVETYFVTYQWYRDNVAISGATTNTLSITNDGSFKVKVTDTLGCTGFSSVLPVNELAIGNTVSPEAIMIFPNPASGVVNISAAIPVNLVIRSIEGKVVMSKTTATSIDIASLASGIYMLYVTDAKNNTLKVEKLVKRSL